MPNIKKIEFRMYPCLKKKEVKQEIIDKKVIPKIPKDPKSDAFMLSILLIKNP